jgi:hypothetical protein
MPLDPVTLRNRITFRLQEARHNTNPTTSDMWLAVSKALVDLGIGGDMNASDIFTDTTGFNNNLSALDSTVQKALDTIDNISLLRSVTQLVTSTDFTKTGDTTLENVPGMTVTLESGSTYKIHSKVGFLLTPANGGLKISLDGSVTTAFSSFFCEIIQDFTNSIPAPLEVPALVKAQQGIVVGDASAIVYSAGTDLGAISGWVDIQGVVKVTNGGTLSLRFAQAVAVEQSELLPMGFLIAERTG